MRTSFLISLFTLFSLFASAQSFESQLVVGINASQIDGDNLWGYNKPGFLLGAMVAYPFSDIVSAQTGLLYSQKGSRHGKDDPFLFIWRLNYLEIPAVVRIQGFEKVYFSGGLTANYFISSKTDTGGAGFVNSQSGFKNFDFCYLAGVAYKPFDRTAFQIRVVNGLGSSNRLRYLQNRSLSFSMLIDLSSP